jgi:signal transduction histidine kinase
VTARETLTGRVLTVPGATMGDMIRRALRETAYCAVSAVLGAAALVTLALALVPGAGATLTVAGTVFGLISIVVALAVARLYSVLQRRLLSRLGHVSIEAPPPFEHGRGPLGRLDRRLQDRVAWRAVGYAAGRLPILLLQAYVTVCAATGIIDILYPVGWALLRNHPPGTTLRPLPPLSPAIPLGGLQIATWPGTFLAVLIGAGWLVLAGLIARPAVIADAWLARSLLGPGRLAQRLSELERTRSLAVDNAAAALRRVERDLHDGAQVRLTSLALHIGLAQELADADTPDLTGIREFLKAAQTDAAGTLSDLRDLARGIHPPVLDKGLPDALASLAAASAIPATLTADLPYRPSQAIETIAYFCVAELVANAAKHSYANRVTITVFARPDALVISVSDDGVGGAAASKGSGLAGLAQRASTVDGAVGVSSPPGGPTVITIELPLTA